MCNSSVQQHIYTAFDKNKIKEKSSRAASESWTQFWLRITSDNHLHELILSSWQQEIPLNWIFTWKIGPCQISLWLVNYLTGNWPAVIKTAPKWITPSPGQISPVHFSPLNRNITSNLYLWFLVSSFCLKPFHYIIT